MNPGGRTAPPLGGRHDPGDPPPDRLLVVTDGDTLTIPTTTIERMQVRRPPDGRIDVEGLRVMPVVSSRGVGLGLLF